MEKNFKKISKLFTSINEFKQYQIKKINESSYDDLMLKYDKINKYYINLRFFYDTSENEVGISIYINIPPNELKNNFSLISTEYEEDYKYNDGLGILVDSFYENNEYTEDLSNGDIFDMFDEEIHNTINNIDINNKFLFNILNKNFNDVKNNINENLDNEEQLYHEIDWDNIKSKTLSFAENKNIPTVGANMIYLFIKQEIEKYKMIN